MLYYRKITSPTDNNANLELKGLGVLLLDLLLDLSLVYRDIG